MTRHQFKMALKKLEDAVSRINCSWRITRWLGVVWSAARIASRFRDDCSRAASMDRSRLPAFDANLRSASVSVFARILRSQATRSASDDPRNWPSF